MQRRPFSLKAHFVGLSCALAGSLLVLTGLAVFGAPIELLLATGAVLVAAMLALGLWTGNRMQTAARTLSGALARLAEGEEVKLSPTFREGHEIALALAAIGTQIKRRTLEAQEGEARYRVLAESLPAMVWVLSHDGRTNFENRRVADYTGGVHLADRDTRSSFIHPDDRALLQEARARADEEHREYQIEVRMRRHDGSYRWHLVTTAPLNLYPPGGDRPFWLSTAIDIEDLKLAEELQVRLTSVLERKVAEATEQLREEIGARQKTERRLRHTQKMEAISRLTGGIAHDLNNKLMVISANIDAVTKHIKGEPGLRRKLLSALVASDQASALISKLLTFARQRDLQVQYIDIAEHLESIISLLNRSFLSASVEVDLSIPEDLWSVEVDPHELETAIVNLAVNARDAMEDGGTITIEARNVTLGTGSLADSGLAGDFVRIVISDAGSGIAPDCLEHVFEPFFTTKEAIGASGLGLSQVHGLAKQLGGTVEISSAVGKGTSVALYLPRAELPARVGSKPEPDDLIVDDETEKPSAEILVGDDEGEVALALQGMLEESGYVVRTAIGAYEAIEAIERRRPSLVLTDVTMPGTKDGVALARELRQSFKNLPVILITGNPMVVAGASEFPLLQKPITSRELRMAIQRHLTPHNGNKVVPIFQGGGRR